MKIALDFDGTLWDHQGVAGPNHVLIAAAKALKAQGHRLILWTCRYDEGLADALRCCTAVGLTFDAVNDNLPEVKDGFGNPRKIVADVYVDDRSAHPSAIDTLLLALQSKGTPPSPESLPKPTTTVFVVGERFVFRQDHMTARKGEAVIVHRVGRLISFVPAPGSTRQYLFNLYPHEIDGILAPSPMEG